MKKTLVLGASTNTLRFSHKAVKSLTRHNFPVIAVGRREGNINDVEIITGKPHFDDIDTLALYIGPRNQTEFYEYILSLKPKRIIFNPGTENDELQKLAEENEIEVVIDCVLLMLNGSRF